jgi:hypothetical protein
MELNQTVIFGNFGVSIVVIAAKTGIRVAILDADF